MQESEDMPSIEISVDTPSGLVSDQPEKESLEDLLAETPTQEPPVSSTKEADAAEPVVFNEDLDVSLQSYLKAILNNEVFVRYSLPSGTVRHDQSVIHAETKWSPRKETFGMTAIPPVEFVETIAELSDAFVGKDTNSEQWVKGIESAALMTAADSAYLNSLKREGSQWRQFVQSETGPLSAARLKFKSNQMSGDQAVMRFTSAFGLSNWIQIPLWHSGFWVTLRCPSEQELSNMHERFLAERVAAARNTYGRVFSNTRAMLTSHLMDLAFSCIIDSTVQNDGNLRRLVSLQDLNTLTWGLACLVWPDGWQVIRSVIGEDEVTKTIQQRTNISRYINIDTSLFSDRQRAHMARRSGDKMTEAQVMDYRHQFPNQGKRRIDLSSFTGDGRELYIDLKVPSIEDHVNSGTRWILDISASFDLIAKVQGGEQARNRHVATHLAATYLRRHEHWIDAIGDADGECTDRDTISETLNRLSELEDVRRKIDEEVHRYTDDTAICVFGIPTYNPKEIATPLPNFPNIIPIDPVQTFFTQLVQKVERLRLR